MVMPAFQMTAQELISMGHTPTPGETKERFVTRMNAMLGVGLPTTQQQLTAHELRDISRLGGGGGTTAPVGDEGDLVGDILGAGAAGAIPGIVAGGAVATLLGILGVGYGASQMIGVQYPWETGAGEGFIAPWSRDIVQDEGGRWVTRETRPDLFANGGVSTAMAAAGAGMVGAAVVKTWSAGGWPFAMTSDGYIHTVTKSGLVKKWKPYKSVVLGKNPSPRMLNRAVGKLVQFDKLHTRIQKMARRIKT